MSEPDHTIIAKEGWDVFLDVADIVSGDFRVESFLEDIKEQCAVNGIEASVPEILWHVLCDIEHILHEHVGDGPRFLADVAASCDEIRGEEKAAAPMRGELDRIMRGHGKK